jgi:hypothetical protein
MQVALSENFKNDTKAKCTRAEKNQFDDFSVDSTDDEDQ